MRKNPWELKLNGTPQHGKAELGGKKGGREKGDDGYDWTRNDIHVHTAQIKRENGGHYCNYEPALIKVVVA